MDDEKFKTQVLMKLQSIEEGLWGRPDSDDKGLAGQVREVCESHFQLKRQFILLIGILIGLGVLAGGGLGLSGIIKK